MWNHFGPPCTKVVRGAPRSIYRTYEISVKSRRRIFRVTFTRPDWRWPIFNGEKVAAFPTTTVGAAAFENFLVASDKKFEPRSDGGKKGGRRVVKFPMKSDSGQPLWRICTNEGSAMWRRVPTIYV